MLLKIKSDKKDKESLRLGNRRWSVPLQAASARGYWGSEAWQPCTVGRWTVSTVLSRSLTGKTREEREVARSKGDVRRVLSFKIYIFKCATEYLSSEVERLTYGLPK